MHFEALMKELPGRENDMSFLVNTLMTTFAYYFIADHYVGDEMTRFSLQVESSSNNLMTSGSVEKVKEMDKIFVQNNFLDLFLNTILPGISCRFVLITGQWHLPALSRDQRMESLLKDKRVYRWFCQNPVRDDHPKYVPIAYGLNIGYRGPSDRCLVRYARALVEREKHPEKDVEILCTPMLATHPSRRVFPSLPRISTKQMYQEISKARYVVSPIGDRHDTYRHFESIGLGAFPLANVGPLYRKLYGDSMVYVPDTQDIMTMYTEQAVPDSVVPSPGGGPCRDLICVSYWREYIEKHSNIDYHLSRLGPIEKKIHISWKNKNVLEDAAHFSLIRNGVQQLKDLNPEYTMEISDDHDVDEYLRAHLLKEDYDRIRDRHIVEKTDLWRLLKIYHEGGVYMDLDRFCNIPLSEVLTKPGVRCVLPTYRNHDLSQDIMISSSGNFMIEKVIRLNLERRRHGATRIVHLGPETYCNALTEILLGYPVSRGDNLPLFEELRALIQRSPYLDTCMEEPPYSTLLFRRKEDSEPVVFDKRALYAQQGVGFHP